MGACVLGDPSMYLRKPRLGEAGGEAGRDDGSSCFGRSGAGAGMGGGLCFGDLDSEIESDFADLVSLGVVGSLRFLMSGAWLPIAWPARWRRLSASALIFCSRSYSPSSIRRASSRAASYLSTGASGGTGRCALGARSFSRPSLGEACVSEGCTAPSSRCLCAFTVWYLLGRAAGCFVAVSCPLVACSSFVFGKGTGGASVATGLLRRYRDGARLTDGSKFPGENVAAMGRGGGAAAAGSLSDCEDRVCSVAARALTVR